MLPWLFALWTMRFLPRLSFYSSSPALYRQGVSGRRSRERREYVHLHDLPAPDDRKTSNLPGGECPVPPGGKVSNKIGNVIDYGSSPKGVICPPYNSALSNTHRSEAREIIHRYRSLKPSDQQAIVDFMKEL